MEIEYVKNYVKFSHLVVGDCFIYNGDLYMKTDHVKSVEQPDQEYNMIHLATGKLLGVGPILNNDQVIKVECKLKVYS